MARRGSSAPPAPPPRCANSPAAGRPGRRCWARPHGSRRRRRSRTRRRRRSGRRATRSSGLFVAFEHAEASASEHAARCWPSRGRLRRSMRSIEDAGRNRAEQPRQHRHGRHPADQQGVVGEPRGEQRHRRARDAVAQVAGDAGREEVGEGRPEPASGRAGARRPRPAVAAPAAVHHRGVDLVPQAGGRRCPARPRLNVQAERFGDAGRGVGLRPGRSSGRRG